MIRIVIPTPKTEAEYCQTVQYKCLSKLSSTNGLLIEYNEEYNPDALELKIIANNSSGLSKVYNDYLQSSNNTEIIGDIVVFMHDDLEIHDQFFVEKLVKAHEIYDIVGLAGAVSQKYTNDKPSVWHLCREKTEDARGIVSHFMPKGFNNSANAHYNSAYFGPTPSPVKVIDGLFMSVNVRTIREKLKDVELFDNSFDFHHYDMAMAINADKHNISMGVWPIFCVHHGLGEFDTPEWKKSHQTFIQKYGNMQTKL